VCGFDFSSAHRTAWITAQRPSRPTTLDPFKPHGFFLEEELAGSGQVVNPATILLTNKECPWRCLMCDLWINTTTQTIPHGAIPRQIDYALAHSAPVPNKSNFTTAAASLTPPPFRRRITRPSPARSRSQSTSWLNRIHVLLEKRRCAFAICFPARWKWRWD